MITLFSHAGHSHSEAGMSDVDHCMPIIIAAGIITIILLSAVVYMLRTWQPKKQGKPAKKKTSK